ncbi:MAG: class I SAM-dependent methyltransferase [Anaerolineales bacterium]|nr:class I SAM-dependent methyltransferase [Anaerolineales bacterium]MCB9144559.1 class I SAM-dependent methyltransferase [Anaerolineales bacterium]
MKPRGLTQTETEKFYDALGAKQDGAGYYEDVTLAQLSRFADFESAISIVEFGCGTGRFAEEMLRLNNASYWGCDVSATMIQLSKKRLATFSERVTLVKSSGDLSLPLPDNSADRFVSNYVLDILSADEIEAVLREAKRILKPDGLLCLTGLTHGKGLFSKAWTAFWNLRFDLNPKWVGGCRPVALTDFLDGWEVLHHNIVTVRGISSEVVVGSKKGNW